MKILKKLALNTDFFNRYISLINDTATIKTISQTVSAITAIAIWYTLAENNLKPLLGWWAIIPSSIFAVVVAIAIEIGLRRFLPYGVRCFIQKRWKGLDGAMSFFILPICCALLMASGWTSFQGSYTVIETVTPDVELKTTTATDSVYIAQKSDNTNIFKSDSLTISTSFKNQISAASKKYEALATSHINKSTQYEARAKKAKGKSNKSWLRVLRDRELIKADLQTSNKDSVIALLETAKANKLLDLLESRRNDKIGADTIHQVATSKIVAFNDVLLAENKSLMNAYGMGLGWITIACLIIFIALTILEEIHKKGSEIEETIVFSQYDVLAPIFTRWTNYLKEWWLGIWHRKLDKWEGNLIAPKLPKKLPPLYYLGDQEQERIEVNADTQQIKDKPLVQEVVDEKENKWNIILAETLGESDKEGFENGFSLKKYQNKISLPNAVQIIQNDAPIIPIGRAKKGQQQRVEIKGFLRPEVNENNPIKRIKIGHRVDVLDLNKLNNRNKEKYKAKQKRRVLKYYNNYHKKHGKKPSYPVIANALALSINTVGKYIREMKASGEIY